MVFEFIGAVWRQVVVAVEALKGFALAVVPGDARDAVEPREELPPAPLKSPRPWTRLALLPPPPPCNPPPLGGNRYLVHKA